LAAGWRYTLADVCKTLANRGKPEERAALCDAGIQAIDGAAKDLPASTKGAFLDLRKELRKIQLTAQGRPNK
jgi:hypothetical protein